jgi:hypothetical protein
VSKESRAEYYEKFSSVLEKARKSPWNKVAFLEGFVTWLLYQKMLRWGGEMFIWGLVFFAIYWIWAEEGISNKSRAEYYEKVFDRLERTGKHTWNWAAFFGGITWMLYRKMYLYAFVLTLVYLWMDLFLCFHAVVKIGGDSWVTAESIGMFEPILPRACLMSLMECFYHIPDRFKYHLANGWTSFENREIWTIVVTSVLIITRICLGYFGNSLYYRIVKKRIKGGYHLVDDAHPTSILSCFGSIFYLLGLGYHPASDPKYVVNKETIRDYLNPDK